MLGCLVVFAAGSFFCVVRRVTDKVRLSFGRMFPVLLQVFCRLILNIFFCNFPFIEPFWDGGFVPYGTCINVT